MSGIAGSGKTTYANKLVKPMSASFICDANSFFMDGGVYKFNASRLKDAHGLCLRKFHSAVKDDVPLVIVDNTNTMVEEIAPYLSLGQAYDYEVEIVTLVCKAKQMRKAHDRSPHRVPIAAVGAQHQRLCNRLKNPSTMWRDVIYTTIDATFAPHSGIPVGLAPAVMPEMNFGSLCVGEKFTVRTGGDVYRKVTDKLYTYDTDVHAVWTYWTPDYTCVIPMPTSDSVE